MKGNGNCKTHRVPEFVDCPSELLRELSASERHACELMEIARMTHQYCSRLHDSSTARKVAAGEAAIRLSPDPYPALLSSGTAFEFWVKSSHG